MTDTVADASALRVRIYYEDTDAGGIVYHTNYAKYMERGRTEWLRALNLTQAELAQRARRLFVVTDLAIQYRKPARLDDIIDVHTGIRRIAHASLVFGQTITRDGELLCSGTVQVACIDADKYRPALLPPDIRHLMEKVQS